MRDMNLAVPTMLEQAGLGLEYLFTGMKESLEATETKFFANNGVVIEEREVVNHDVRLRARTELAKMHRLYPRWDEPTTERSGAIGGPTFNLVIVDGARAQELLGRLANQSGGNLKPPVDAALDENQGRAGSAESV